MVILHIANIDISILGGVQVVVPQLLAAQSKYATVGFLNTNGTQIEGVTMLPAEKTFSLESFPLPFRCPDLVVFHEIYRIEYIGIYRALKKRGVPYIIVPHASLTKHAQSLKHFKKSVANILLFNEFIYSAEAVQFLTEQEKLATPFDVKSFVCGNGIAVPDKFKATFSEEGFKLLYIGRIDLFHKGIDLMISAISACRELLKERQCKVYLYGPDIHGVHQEVRRLLRDSHVADLVELRKEITGEQKENALLMADCFIQTSRFEGMPMGILEALAYGLPCIVTEGTNMANFISEHDAGWSCETTVDGIACALRRAVSEKGALAEKSEHAAELIRSAFQWDIVAEDTLTHYKRIVKTRV